MSLPTLSNQLVMDPAATQGIAALSHKDPKAALKAVAGQFEGLLLGQLMSAMRENSLGGEDDTGAMDTFRGMYDQQLVEGMVQSGGMGLANMLTQQLMRQANLSDGQQELPPPGVQLPPVVSRARLQQAYGDGLSSTAAATPDSSTDALPSDKTGFVAALLPHARRAAERLGVAPEVLVAHAALESGWGRRMLRQPDGQNSFNLFGIKASTNWQGDSVAALTTEYESGKAKKQVESFRAYQSYGQAFDDYAQLIENSPRYRQALNLGGDFGAYAQALQRGGYATDPAYAAKLQAVAKSVVAL
ncbi:flagellar assembly peptidoglycan hydrolase FlgJ [Vogesella oryzae]|uniref:flagellar assembly peptidoglycan hydrolase FlgJ n=1 Tax=Vogesella oryzae TaxID=1735285 RepID=UPI0015822BB2|nr:flagellar assembly peptidoglycan hydrolase FlgJ [Vogesella oryzae]